MILFTNNVLNHHKNEINENEIKISQQNQKYFKMYFGSPKYATFQPQIEIC